jgi:hypothetical protein
MTGCLKGDNQYVALRRQEVVGWVTKEKGEKIGQVNTMKTNSKRRKDLLCPLGMYDHVTDQAAFVLRLMSSGNTI